MRLTVSDITNTVGLTDLSDDEVETATFVSREMLRDGIDVAESLGWDEFELGTTFGDVDPDGEDPPVLVIRKSEHQSAGIVIAPRLTQ